MAKLGRIELQAEALRILEESAGGIRWSVLINQIYSRHPETPRNTVDGAVFNLVKTNKDILKTARGIYQLARFQEEQSESAVAADTAVAQTSLLVQLAGGAERTIVEADFYQSFATWLTESPKR